MDLLSPCSVAREFSQEPPKCSPSQANSSNLEGSQKEMCLKILADESRVEMEVLSKKKGARAEESGGRSPPTQVSTDMILDCGREDDSRSSHSQETIALTCHHSDFPFCSCVTRTANSRNSHGRLGRRPGRRSHRVPSLAALRDTSLEVFDETEESDFQESETEADAPHVNMSESESDSVVGQEYDAEGAVGGDASGTLQVPPSSTSVRRASIVTADSRRDAICASPEPVKVAVFGSDGVGKSALIVRLLTGRFIGEYDPTLEAMYSYQIPLPDYPLPLQVMDTAGHVEVAEAGRERQVSWGEGFMLVFSLTSHTSFMALSHLRRVILELTPGAPRPMVLVGNKADLTHARQVSDDEIRALTSTWGCDYFEVAAPEPWETVVRPFTALYQAILFRRTSH